MKITWVVLWWSGPTFALVGTTRERFSSFIVYLYLGLLGLMQQSGNGVA